MSTPFNDVEGYDQNAESVARQRAMRSDKGFKLAMLAARSGNQERFTLGVIDTPCTNRPQFVPHRGLPLRSNASPAAQCADFGSAGGNKF